MEDDRADSDFDSDCTGDDAGSDELYVKLKNLKIKNQRRLGALLSLLYILFLRREQQSPEFFLGALNLFNLRREQDIIPYPRITHLTY